MSRKKKRVVCVVGSRSFPLTPAVGAEVVDLLRAYPQGTVFLTRGSEGFDEFVVRACGLLGLPVEMWHSAGGAANFLRDAEMVRAADEVLVFLDPGTLHDERTGTAHILSKSLDQKRTTKAYSCSNDHLIYAGSSE